MVLSSLGLYRRKGMIICKLHSKFVFCCDTIDITILKIIQHNNIIDIEQLI